MVAQRSGFRHILALQPQEIGISDLRLLYCTRFCPDLSDKVLVSYARTVA